MHVLYKDSETLLSTATEKRLLENIEARDTRLRQLEAQLDRMRGRINRFIASVDSLKFSVVESDAQPWMEQWGAYLLNGRIPRSEAEVEAESINLADVAPEEDERTPFEQ